MIIFIKEGRREIQEIFKIITIGRPARQGTDTAIPREPEWGI